MNFINLKKKNDTNNNTYHVVENNNENKPEKKNKTVTRIIITILILIILLLGFKVLAPNKPADQGNVTLTIGEDITPEAAQQAVGDLYVTFAGMVDATINSDSTVSLQNLEENGDIVMAFEVYEGDKLIHSTDYVAAGQQLTWKAGRDLSAGVHNLKLVQTPKVLVGDAYIPLSNGACEFTLTKL